MASRSVKKFTDNLIKSLQQESSDYTVSCNSLELRVYKTGTKSWSFAYRFKGKAGRLTIGRYPYISIADANATVLDARKLLANGIDPSEHKRQLEEAAEIERDTSLTVNDLYNLWMKWNEDRGLSLRTLKDQRYELPKLVLPEWGTLPVKSITRKMAITLLQEMADAGKITAEEHVRAYISSMWQRAVDLEIVDNHPFTKLPKVYAPKQIQIEKTKTKRDTTRYLNDAEIYKFWYGSIKYCEPIPGAVLRLMLLLGRRGIDVRPMLKSEIDLDRQIWHMTPGKIRNAKLPNFTPVIMPLPTLSFNIIKELMVKRTKVDLMFPSNDVDCIGLPITQSAISQPVTRHNRFDILNPWTPHDLRRTAATGMSHLGIDQPIINKVLAHKLGPLESIYNQNSFIKERQVALTAWNDYIYKIITGPAPESN